MTTPREELASTLKQARIDAGYRSQGALAKVMVVNRTVVTKAESSSQPVPSEGTLSAWATATKADLAELTGLAARCRSSTPEWFIPYLGPESKATLIRIWSPLIVPGLLQTVRYAHEILSVQPYSAERIAELVKERMRRQSVLDHAYLTAALDVGVLARCMGSAEVMAGQCRHLIDIAQHPNVAVHIVPEHTNTGAWAELDIASHGGTATVDLSTAIDDVPSTAPGVIDSAVRTFDRIMGHALTTGASLDCMATWEAKWNQQA